MTALKALTLLLAVMTSSLWLPARVPPPPPPIELRLESGWVLPDYEPDELLDWYRAEPIRWIWDDGEWVLIDGR